MRFLKKKTLFYTALLLSAVSFSQQAFANEKEVTVMVDGVQQTFDQQPMVIDGVTYIPVRNVATTTGSEVYWYQKEKKVEILKGEQKISFKLGENHGKKNGQSVEMPVSFLNQQTNRTMVPLRFASEQLNLDVKWNNQNKIVTIATKKENKPIEKEEVIPEVVVPVTPVAPVEETVVPEVKPPEQVTPTPVEKPIITEPTLPTELPKERVSTEARMAIVQSLQKNAEKYIGTPYLYGASPNITTFFDCSSFTQRLFGESGITLSRTSTSQFTGGKEVSVTNLLPGDLLFFDTANSGKITHVAIYINENTLLQSTLSKGVGYTDFGSYWKTRLIKAASVID